MKKIFFLLLFIFTIAAANAQTAPALKKIMELVMPGEDGHNGASVVWHPVQKRYYTAFAGNSIFPMAVFDIKGKEVSDGTLTAGYDLRGMWFNPKTKAIEANCYDTIGWVRYKLNAKGLPESSANFLSGMNQPSEQSVGVYNPKINSVYFLTADGVSVYEMDGTNTSTITLKKTKDGEDMMFSDDNKTYNNISLIYTGIPKAELGLLNTEDKKIELFNSTTGIYTSSWALPDDAVVNSIFNFAYANGIVWLFDKEARTWRGYK